MWLLSNEAYQRCSQYPLLRQYLEEGWHCHSLLLHLCTRLVHFLWALGTFGSTSFGMYPTLSNISLYWITCFSKYPLFSSLLVIQLDNGSTPPPAKYEPKTVFHVLDMYIRYSSNPLVYQNKQRKLHNIMITSSLFQPINHQLPISHPSLQPHALKCPKMEQIQ